MTSSMFTSAVAQTRTRDKDKNEDEDKDQDKDQDKKESCRCSIAGRQFDLEKGAADPPPDGDSGHS